MDDVEQANHEAILTLEEVKYLLSGAKPKKRYRKLWEQFARSITRAKQ